MNRACKLAVVGAGVLVLAACKGESNDVEIAVYESVEACVTAGKSSERLCQHFYNKALELHDTASPDYPSRAECEGAEGVGSCEKLINNRHDKRHRPAMVGFLVPAVQGAQSQAFYRAFDTKFSFRTAANAPFTPNAAGMARIPRAALAPPTAATAVRAGFGGIVTAAPAAGAAGAAGAKTAATKTPPGK